MSLEEFIKLHKMNMKSIEIQLALQCAPLITGIKISNLFIVSNHNARYVRVLFENNGISIFVLCTTSEKTTFLLYRSRELAKYLNNKEVKELLFVLGYHNYSVKHLLAVVKDKYEKYMENGIEFPHELGLLLGYPVEDVSGFILNRGQNCLLVGYWKVYKNVIEKQKLFEQYNKAKETIVRLVLNGVSILDIIAMYSKNKLQRQQGG